MGDILIPDALCIANVAWMLSNTSRSGGAGFSGSEQIIQMPTGRWKATMTFNVFSGLEDPSALIYRSLIRRGRAATILVPEADTRGPAQYAGITISQQGVRFSDNSNFSDGSGFMQKYALATLAESAAMNATVLRISLASGLVLIPGMRFSTPDFRMHEIDDILSSDGNGNWQVIIAPWLRTAYAAGTVIDFDRPVCRMRLASDDTGRAVIGNRSLDTPSIDFVEAF